MHSTKQILRLLQTIKQGFCDALYHSMPIVLPKVIDDGR